MIRRLEKPEDFPGQQRVVWRKEPQHTVLAVILGVFWPPLWITLAIWRPHNWMPGLEMDWRLQLFGLGLLGVPAILWLLAQERRRTGRPATRLGVVWRFMFYGGLLAVILAALFAFWQLILQWTNAANVGEGVGSSETTLLIYGVAGMPFAAVIGVAYALWAGLCVAFVAFTPQPEVRDRLGVMGRGGAG
ncbi:phthalate transporter [Brevundimonas sp. FT23042]|uniref:phthalate transporter n=1 Tax=Brevundimonas sp. FT23042 TaxID=3393749 RepID=UPI003B58960D